MKKAILLFALLLPITTFYMQGNLEATASIAFLPVISPVEDQPIATDSQLMHSLILVNDKIIVNSPFGEEVTIPFDQLGTYLKDHLPTINKQPLHIAVAKGTDYREVIKVVDLMATYGVSGYQLVRYD